MSSKRKPVRGLTMDDPTLKTRVSLQVYDPKIRGYKFVSARSVRFTLGRHSDADMIWQRIVSLLRQLHDQTEDSDRPPRPVTGGTMAVSGSAAVPGA